MFSKLVFFLFFVLSVDFLSAIQEIPNGAAAEESQSTGRYDLMIAFQKSYYPQFLNVTNGEWQTYPVKTIIDVSDRSSVLNFCKQVYSYRNVKNYVLNNERVSINNWCSVKTPWKTNCKKTFDVQPIRCIETFETDALLVPDNCVFDHIQNHSKCWSFNRWNKTAQLACRDRGLKIESFAMLMPCGEDLSVFSGVEFVCCPKKSTSAAVAPASVTTSAKSSDFPIAENDELLDFKDDLNENKDNLDSGATSVAGVDNDENEDQPDLEVFDDPDEKDELEKEEEELDDIESSSSASTTTSTTTTTSSTTTTTVSGSITEITNAAIFTNKPSSTTPDPYFSTYDPKHERLNYIAAIKRADKRFEEAMENLKTDRDNFEERYQVLLMKDYKEADEYRNKTIEDLEQKQKDLEFERNSIKDQIMDMHKQRVAANLNQLVKNATVNFWSVLTSSKITEKDVYPVIFGLLKAYNKDRTHTYVRYKHLLEMEFEWARGQKNIILKHLLIIGKNVNESIDYLKEEEPAIWEKLKISVDNLNDELQLHSPVIGSILEISKESEERILDNFIMEAKAKRDMSEQEKYRKKLEKEMLKKEQFRQMRIEQDTVKNHDSNDQMATQSKNAQVPSPKMGHVSEIVSTMSLDKSPEITEVKIEKIKKIDNEAIQQTMEEVAALIHDRRPEMEMPRSLFQTHGPNPFRNDAFLRLFTAVTCLFIFVLLVAMLTKGRSSKSPKRQGFIEVDQVISPEERHVTQMQINGYENPTYKYFEVKE